VPKLVVLQGPDKGRTFQTGDESFVLGRSSEQALLTDNTISRHHAELRRVEGAWLIEDRGSSNGTYLNGVRVAKPIWLKRGDQIRLGSTLLVFAGDEQSEATIRGLVDLDAGGKYVDSAIMVTVPSNEDSVIIAAPETADAVRAWRVMYSLAETLGSILSEQELLERVMDVIFEQVPVDRGFILMKDPQTEDLIAHVVRYRTRGGRNGPDEKQPITTSRRIIDHVSHKHEAVLCTNAMTDRRFASVNNKNEGSIHDFSLRSVICAPIIARDQLLGAIHIDCSMTAHTYSEEQLRLVTAIGYQTGLALENLQLVAQRMQQERLAAVGETVAYLSHHIKNILQGMRSGADLLELGLAKKREEQIRQGWGIVHKNLDKVMDLTMNMLAFSKDREPRLDYVQLNHLVNEVVELAQHTADERHIMLLTDLEENIPPIMLDADGISRALLNVVVNALDAVPHVEGIIHVKTHYDAVNKIATISVLDNGPGIPENQIAAIFQPFHSTKGNAGTGLGLAVAKKVLDEHRGRIEVTSNSVDGTVFSLQIPTVEGAKFDSTDTLGAVQRSSTAR
jgi:two-component system, NtrC family, sensor kinase